MEENRIHANSLRSATKRFCRCISRSKRVRKVLSAVQVGPCLVDGTETDQVIVSEVGITNRLVFDTSLTDQI